MVQIEGKEELLRWLGSFRASEGLFIVQTMIY
jgi:hypothetical protein